MKTPITMTQTYYQVFPTNYIFQKEQTIKTMQPNNKQKEQQQIYNSCIDVIAI